MIHFFCDFESRISSGECSANHAADKQKCPDKRADHRHGKCSNNDRSTSQYSANSYTCINCFFSSMIKLLDVITLQIGGFISKNDRKSNIFSIFIF